MTSETVIEGNPCERVINERDLIHIPDNLMDYLSATT